MARDLATEQNGSPSTVSSLRNNGTLHSPISVGLSVLTHAREIPEPATAMDIRQAVIMAGGKGTRLLPYSALLPKPLMPLDDMTVLELLLRRMKNAGVTDVIIAISHLGRLIEAYFGDGSSIGIRIRYATEDHPLGTAGALGAVIDELDDDFFVTNGDLLTTLNLRRMMAAHRTTQADASIGIYKREVKIDFGLVDVDDEKRLVGYREKPQTDYLVSMGIYLLHRDAVAPHIRYNQYLDMPTLLLRMKAASMDVRCYHEECVWLDIGRPDDFGLAQQMFKEDRALFLGA
jgi:NDP-sugar pyrophosphorylase family protein